MTTERPAAVGLGTFLVLARDRRYPRALARCGALSGGGRPVL